MNQAAEDKTTIRRLATAIALMGLGAVALVGLAIVVTRLY